MPLARLAAAASVAAIVDEAFRHWKKNRMQVRSVHIACEVAADRPPRMDSFFAQLSLPFVAQLDRFHPAFVAASAVGVVAVAVGVVAVAADDDKKPLNAGSAGSSSHCRGRPGYRR